MRSLPRLGLTLLSSVVMSCGLSAQAPSPAPQAAASSALALAVTSSAQGCPVGLWASRASNGGLVEVDRASAKAWEHAYRVSFGPTGAHLDTKTIAQARITLRGLAGPQILPAGKQPEANATETFTVAPSAAPQHLLVQSVVYAQKITGVQWIELNEVTFTDGSRWHESSTAECRVAPNGFMLVASGH